MGIRLPGPSIADCAARPQNNFTLLRFLAAVLVIYSHSYPLAGVRGESGPLRHLLQFTNYGHIGVDMFFVISGFLVTASYLNRGSFASYFKSRCLRIFPGLLVCLLLTAFVLGPLVSSQPAADYFSARETYAFVYRNLMFVVQYTLPGVFTDLPVPAVNGSLWTLPVEFRLYIVLGLLGAAGVLAKRRLYLWLVLALAAVVLAVPVEVSLTFNQKPNVHLFMFFFAGSLLCVYARWVPVSGLVLLALMALSLPFYHTRAFPWLCGTVLMYAVIWFAYLPGLHAFDRVGDYSYGLYIYAFPIQEALRQYFTQIHPWAMFAAATPLTLICAMFSWHLIEERALRLKSIDFSERLGAYGRRLLPWALFRRRQP
ncbi:MAG TPA: acyltransferase [Gammaproteobacteria bacterium]|nr:acyltransferase [Gammaproteobacteria bacterium]